MVRSRRERTGGDDVGYPVTVWDLIIANFIIPFVGYYTKAMRDHKWVFSKSCWRRVPAKGQKSVGFWLPLSKN
jgi:hypothetical protein